MKISRITAGLLLATGLAFGTAQATQQDERFGALAGVNVQAMTDTEMQATTGELNAYDVLAPLLARAQDNPQAFQALVQLAERSNAFLARLGLLTPCVSCCIGATAQVCQGKR